MATSAATTGMGRIPSELRKMITGYLEETTDIQNIRLVFREACDWTNPQLFRSIHLKFSIRSLENAKNIIEVFGKYVKDIYICPLIYEPYSQTEVPLYNIVKGRLTGRVVRPQEHFQLSFANYQKNERLTVKMLDSGLLGTQLLLALNKLPNISRIIFTTKFNPKYTNVEWHDACPDHMTCNLTKEQHKAFYPPPTKTWNHQDNGDKLMHNIFMNMYASDKVVEELIILPQTALCAGVFANMTEWELTHARTIFSRLTKLVLNLDPSVYENNWIGWHQQHISGLLAGAVNLKVLALKVHERPAGNLLSTVSDGWEKSKLEALLHNCSFPLLEALYLGNITATARQIGDFLQGNPTLGTLYIEGCSLHDGLWRHVANDLRGRRSPVGLRNAFLNELDNGFEGFHRNQFWVR